MGLLLAFGIAFLDLGLLSFFKVVLTRVASVYYVGAPYVIAGLTGFLYPLRVLRADRAARVSPSSAITR